MTPLEQAKKDMTTLKFVQWDRYVKHVDALFFYGWIKRKDKYKDFVVLEYFNTPTGFKRIFITSSAKFSPIITKLLTNENHKNYACKRIETLFDLPNVIKLSLPRE